MIMSVGQGLGYSVFIIFPQVSFLLALFLVTVSTQVLFLNRSHS